MTMDMREIYVTALHNTHALELQALQIMERQIERLENYPEIKSALQSHVKETNDQRDRLEVALGKLSEKPSTLKEGVLGFVGNMMAVAHTPAQDEILKNSFANQAFENYEIAVYKALIVIAQQASANEDVSLFEKSLKEEVAMAETVAGLIVPTTTKYLKLTLADKTAGR